MRHLIILISLIALISLTLNFKLLRDRFVQKKATFKVLEVIDGDTFRISDSNETRRVRLMGVDAPELGKCLSDEAKYKLAELVSSKEVTLEDQFTDPYGRIMANVFIADRYINKEILASGLGRMDYDENPRREELKTAYAQARTKKLGLFSSFCISTVPPVSNTGIPCSIKGNLDDNTRKKSYFLPGCNNYAQVTIDLSTDDQWFCTEGEAVKAGFAKSRTCD